MRKYFIGFVILSFAAFFYFTASAQEGSNADIKWHNCAQSAMQEFVAQGSEKVEEIMCDALFQLKPGPECDESVFVLQQLNFFEEQVSKYFYEQIIVPKCGEHPQQ